MPQNFVGRAKELEVLEHHLNEARQGLGKLVFVSGEAGMGKTALIRKFLEQKEDTCLVSSYECRDRQRNKPYFPLKYALLELNAIILNQSPEANKTIGKKILTIINATGPEWIPHLLGLGGIVTTVLHTLQAIETQFGDPQKIKKTVKRPEDIWELFEEELRRLAQEKPVIVFWDNVQWTDPSSLEFLFALGKSLREQPFAVYFLLSYRQEELAEGRNQLLPDGSYQTEQHPLADILNKLCGYARQEAHVQRTDQWLVELEVPPLSREEIQAVISQEFSQNDFPPDFSAQLSNLSEGNPLFLTELLTSLEHDGSIFADNDHCFHLKADVLQDLPTSINGVIADRIERLPDNLKKVLDCAAVNGERFIAQIIAQVLTLDELDVLERLAELNQKHELIIEEATRNVKDVTLELYRFRHTLVYNYVYQNIDPPIRRALHRKIAEVMKSLYGEEFSKLPHVQEHYLRHVQIGRGLLDGTTLQLTTASEGQGDPETVLVAAQSAVEAAKYSYQQYAMAECLDQTNTALALLAQLSDLSDEAKALKFETLRHRSRAQSWLGKYQEAYLIAQQMLPLAEELNDNERISRALHRLALESSKLGNYKQAITYNERKLELDLAAGRDRDVATTYTTLGLQYDKLSDYDQAIEFYRKSLEITKNLNDPHGLSVLYNNIGSALKSKGEYDGAISYYRKAMEIDETLLDQARAAVDYNNLGTALRAKGEYDEAMEYFQKALTIDKKLKNWVKVAIHYNNLGAALQAKEDYEGAVNNYQKALAINEKFENRVELAKTCWNLGMLHKKLEKYGEALPLLEQAQDLWQKLKHKHILQEYAVDETVTELRGKVKQAEASN